MVKPVRRQREVLSEAQMLALRRLAAGASATTPLPFGSTYWSTDKTGVNVRTLYALCEKKLVRQDRSDWRWITWTITAAGRRTLGKPANPRQ